MILTASRRTDIPAFYADWFFHRLKQGYALVPHPRSRNRFSRVSLSPQGIDCIVFFTKNPAPILDRLSEHPYPSYVQFTLTPYDKTIEPDLPEKEALIETFRALSRLIGPHRVVWRYDPIILTPLMDIDYHLSAFAHLARALDGYTQRCIFSFLDLYPKIKGAMRAIGALDIPADAMNLIAEGFAAIAQKHDLELMTCCEAIDLSVYGIKHASCVDAALISRIIGYPIVAKKDPGQRPGCGCMPSVDIGTYDTCLHGCRYCYATVERKPSSQPESLQAALPLANCNDETAARGLPCGPASTQSALLLTNCHDATSARGPSSGSEALHTASPHGSYTTDVTAISRENARYHDPSSPLLFGCLPDDAIITERDMRTLKTDQMTLF